jgi:hypothetical protein
MTHTAKNFLPTSIPAHRSMDAEIISVLLFWLRAGAARA